MELKNKVALITGATGGIGSEAAKLLAAEGAEVIVTGRQSERGRAALGSLTRTWAAEFSAAGVRVNTVSPGPTHTDSVVAAMGEAGAEEVAKTTLLGRQAAPREIADVILFLASDRSSYITGATVAVDAGRTAI